MFFGNVNGLHINQKMENLGIACGDYQLQIFDFENKSKIKKIWKYESFDSIWDVKWSPNRPNIFSSCGSKIEFFDLCLDPEVQVSFILSCLYYLLIHLL